jgi:uncharacterized membrane protein YraQ (UPF0718 family)
LGYDLGVARAIGAISFSILIGLIMAFIWRKEELDKKNKSTEFVVPEGEKPKHEGITVLYFAVLVGILVFGAAKNWLVTGILLVFLLLILYRWFKKEELKNWMYQTWDLGKKIFPLLIVGVFLAGVMKKIVPQEVVEHLVGGNGLRANLVAALFGAVMYFSTLMEVPVLKALMDLGMGKGPALTLLLADPALSLPSIIVLTKLIGIKKTGVYVGLVVVMSTIIGMSFGAFVS